MDVTSVSTAVAAGTRARQALSANYDTFLKLLTAQLQNQDPLSPMDTNQFTQQLVMYSQVEQQISTNDNLNSLIALTKSAAGSNAVGYLGKTALTLGPSTSLSDGAASWRYTLPRDAAGATLTVSDAAGRTVFTASGPADLGPHDFVWDGRNAQGVMQADGVYRLSVAATAADGSVLSPAISGAGVVREIDMSGPQPLVTVGNRKIDLSEILGLKN
jgi:flagellar basal-body rod modification protein FlgD